MRNQSSVSVKSVFAAVLVLLLLFSSLSVCFGCTRNRENAKNTALTEDHVEKNAVGTTEETAVEVSAGVRRAGVINLLLCGKDRASGLYDVIILAQFDPKNHAANLLQIPRDTYASYTEKSYRKLNGAASALGGISGMANFLSENLGIPIDHYALVDLDCIGDVVDAIGGVTMTIPADMDYEDRSQGLSIHLKAGTQTLNGDLAEQFLRYRSGYATADLGRLDAQKLFLSAFLSEVKKNATLPGIIRIVRTLYGRVETDLSLGDCIKLASAGMKLTPERMTMATLPGESARTGETEGAWYYILCREAAYDTVNRMLNVYETPLPASDFDPHERFTGHSYPHFEAIYRSSAKAAKTVTGKNSSDCYEAVPRIRE